MGIKIFIKEVIKDICVEGLNMDEQKVHKMLNKSEILRKEREKVKAERAEKNRQKREAKKIEQARRAEQMRIEEEKWKKQLEEQRAMRQAEIDSRNRYILDKYKYSGWCPETSFPEDYYNKISESIEKLKDEITKNAIVNGLQPNRELATSVKLAELIKEREKWVMDRAHARIFHSILKHIARDNSIMSEERIEDIPDDRFIRAVKEYSNNHKMVEEIFKKGYAFNYYKSFPNDPISHKKAMSIDEFWTKVELFSKEYNSRYEKLCQTLNQTREDYYRLMSMQPVRRCSTAQDMAQYYAEEEYNGNEYYAKKYAWDARRAYVMGEMKSADASINRLSGELLQIYGLDPHVMELLNSGNLTAKFLIIGL